MRRIVCVFLAICLALSLAACGTEPAETAQKTAVPAQETAAPVQETSAPAAPESEEPDWQNPVMNFIGEYQSGRARALVECSGTDEARITIEWSSSAWELGRWDIVGPLDLDTLTIAYSGVAKIIVTYDDDGKVKSQEPEYEDGTGTITFNDDGTFTWHEDQSAYGTDLVFEWVPASA